MEPASGGSWRDELNTYFCSVEHLTRESLKRIKRDRIRNHLPIDESFKKYFIDRTSFRIADVYVDLMYEERVDEEVNQQSFGNTIATEEEQRTESEMTMTQLLGLNSSEGDNGHITSGSRMVAQSTSTKTDRPKRSEPLQMASTIQQPATIDLTSDQEDTADTLSSDKNMDGQTQLNIRHQNADEAPTAGNSKEMERFRIFLHGDTQLQSKNCVAQPSEPNTPLLKNQESSSDSNARRVVNGYEKRQNVGDDPVGRFDSSSAQSSNTIDSMTNHPQSAKENINEAAKEVESVVEQARPKIQPQNTKSNKSNGSAPMKKKPKSAGVEVTGKRQHKCDDCDYSTKNKYELTRHIRTHIGERPHECEVCEKRFNRKTHLSGHMKTHRNLFQFQCSNCRQGFSDEIKWKSHQSRCKVTSYECHLCKKIFLRKHQLVDHMRAHTGEKLRCSMCRKRFNSNNGLKFHMKSHGKQFRFQCLNCRQGFSHETPWKSHESRCKLKQYECFLCNKKFHHRKSSLLRHMRHKHTGELQFGCSDCPKRFCQKSNLTRHTKRCHSKGN